MINNYDKDLLILLLFSHFLDCLDGTLARMFNLTSEFGDFLDQISDKIFLATTLLITIYKCNNLVDRNRLIAIGLILTLIVLKCIIVDKCTEQYIVDMNAMVIIVIIYNYYKLNTTR